jgi:hypothetical protein
VPDSLPWPTSGHQPGRASRTTKRRQTTGTTPWFTRARKAPPKTRKTSGSRLDRTTYLGLHDSSSKSSDSQLNELVGIARLLNGPKVGCPHYLGFVDFQRAQDSVCAVQDAVGGRARREVNRDEEARSLETPSLSSDGVASRHEWRIR